MDSTILLMIFFTAIVLIAWAGKYRLSFILYIVFLILLALLFSHHMTDQLQLSF